MTWAESKLYSEQHSKVAKNWHELVKKDLVMEPFHLYLNSLVKKNYEEKIKKYKEKFIKNSKSLENLKNPLIKSPKNIDESYNIIISYLNGTARFYKEKKEKEIKAKLKINNFKKK